MKKAEASKSIVIGIDNGAEYCGHEINAEIGIGVIGFSSTHTHLSEVDYSPIRCDSEHAYERKTVSNILSCPDTIHSNSVNIGPISISSNGDVSLSLQGWKCRNSAPVQRDKDQRSRRGRNR